jgi:hypothetical protein
VVSCNVWVCVSVSFVMCVSFGNMCTCIYCVLYCLYCVFFLYCFVYVFVFLFIFSLLPPSDNSIAVSNNNNNRLEDTIKMHHKEIGCKDVD